MTVVLVLLAIGMGMYTLYKGVQYLIFDVMSPFD